MSWASSADVKRAYATASIIDNEQVIFNIKGNDYRLVTVIDYRRGIVFIKWISTHAAYDRIDTRTVQYGDYGPLRTEQDHDGALREIERLWGADPGTLEGNRLYVLATLVEAYEQAHWLMDPPDPIAAIHFRLDQQGLDERALIGVIGPADRVRELMSGLRPLTLPMIRRLHETFGIPAEILIRQVQTRSDPAAAE